MESENVNAEQEKLDEQRRIEEFLERFKESETASTGFESMESEDVSAEQKKHIVTALSNLKSEIGKFKQPIDDATRGHSKLQQRIESLEQARKRDRNLLILGCCAITAWQFRKTACIEVIEY